MPTKEERVNFLMLNLSECELSRRLKDGLKQDNHPNIFSVLRLDVPALKRTPGLGDRSLAELREYIAPYGFKIGDADRFFETNKGLAEKTLFTKNPTVENAVALRNAAGMFIDELDAIRPPSSEVSAASDLNWIIPLLPENLRTGLTKEFLTSALDNPTLKAEIAPHLEAATAAATKAIAQQLFGRPYTFLAK